MGKLKRRVPARVWLAWHNDGPYCWSFGALIVSSIGYVLLKKKQKNAQLSVSEIGQLSDIFEEEQTSDLI